MSNVVGTMEHSAPSSPLAPFSVNHAHNAVHFVLSSLSSRRSRRALSSILNQPRQHTPRSERRRLGHKKGRRHHERTVATDCVRSIAAADEGETLYDRRKLCNRVSMGAGASTVQAPPPKFQKPVVREDEDGQPRSMFFCVPMDEKVKVKAPQVRTHKTTRLVRGVGLWDVHGMTPASGCTSEERMRANLIPNCGRPSL
jgi:hypothetical protein